jgi:leucyl aminopeptidase
MKLALNTGNLDSLKNHSHGYLVLLVPDDYAQHWEQKQVTELRLFLDTLVQNKSFSTKIGETFFINQVRNIPGLTTQQLLLAACGKGDKASLSQAIQSVCKIIKKLPQKHCTLSLNLLPKVLQHIPLIAKTLQTHLYTYTHSKPSAKTSPLEKIAIILDNSHLQNIQEIPDQLAKAKAQITAHQTTCEWANRPPNHATPEALAKAAQTLAEQHDHIQCTILKQKDIEAMGMGAFLAVAQGSAQEPHFIELQYQGLPTEDKPSSKPLVLVGKGITFDSGGISLKPPANMDEMKFDMCGAASVLGVFAGLAELQPQINVVGLIPTCENLPSGTAVKPGDVVTSMSGKTIEILNTDAEGRLILCDALTYAKRFQPQAVVDIATLTGACVIALGGERAGLFSPDDDLANRLLQAGEKAHDLCWRMPLDDSYSEGLKSNFADTANIAGRGAGSITAAKFLEQFTQDYPWAHLDIAGVAWKSGNEKGATGRPVGLLLEFLLSYV